MDGHKASGSMNPTPFTGGSVNRIDFGRGLIREAVMGNDTTTPILRADARKVHLPKTHQNLKRGNARQIR